MTYRVEGGPGGVSFRVVDERGEVGEIGAFLEAVESRGLSPATVRAYAFDLLTVYRWLAATKRTLSSIGQNDLLDFVSWERGRGAHPKSINRRLVVCSLLYRFHHGQEPPTKAGSSMPSGYYRGPGRDRVVGARRLGKKRRGVLQVKEPRKLPCPLEAEQARLFLRSLRRYRDIGIVHLMILCGLRSREVRTLTQKNVSLSERRIRVVGKGDKERVLPLADLAAVAIEQYLALERPLVCADDTLFVSLVGKHRGHAMSAAGFRKIFRTRRKRSELENANPHRFRHTFGADMARSGMSLPVLQRLMGHSNPETTLLYINLSMADLAEAYLAASSQIEKKYDLE